MSFATISYNQIFDRISLNTGLDRKDGNELREMKYDVYDTLVNSYAKGENPVKRFYAKLEKYPEITEDFADSTFISGLSSDLAFAGGESFVTEDTGAISYSGQSLIKFGVHQVKLNAYVDGGATGSIEVTVTKDGSEVYNSTEAVTNTSSEEFSFNVGAEGLDNFSIAIAVTGEVEVPGSGDKLYIEDLTIVGYGAGVELPSDFYLPREVQYRDEDGNDLVSREMTHDQYLRWVPGRNYPTESFTQLIDDIDIQRTQISWTSENTDYDGTIGYLINMMISTAWLMHKPIITGEVEVLYVSLPVFDLSTLGDDAEIHRAFTDIIVLSSSIKILTRRLKESKNEVEYIGRRAQIKDYREDLREAQDQFGSFLNQRTNNLYIEPFDFLNDPNTRVNGGRW